MITCNLYAVTGVQVTGVQVAGFKSQVLKGPSLNSASQQ